MSPLTSQFKTSNIEQSNLKTRQVLKRDMQLLDYVHKQTTFNNGYSLTAFMQWAVLSGTALSVTQACCVRYEFGVSGH